MAAGSSAKVDSGQGLAGIANLLQTIGGTQSTTKNTGDASGLYNVQAALQGQDFTKMLEGIFQQAAGAIPGLQSRVTNAVGARSGDNGSLQALLQKTLAQTTLQAQEQIARQQGQNLATRGQVAGDIARVTNSPTMSQGLNYGNTAKVLGGAQLLSKVPDAYKKGKELFGGLFDSSGEVAPELTSSASGLMEFDAPSIEVSSAPMSEGIDYGGIVEGVGEAWDGAVDWFDGLEFADGGLVGRDGKKPSRVRRHLQEAEDEAEGGQSRSAELKRLNEEEKKKRESKAKDEYDRTSKMVDQNTGIRFADGGEVKVGGGRASSRDTFTPDAIIQSIAQQGTGALGPAAPSTTGTNPGQNANPRDAQDAAEGYGPAMGKIGLTALTGNPIAALAALMDAMASQQNPEAAAVKPMQTANTAIQSLMTQNPLAIITTLAKLALSGKKDKSDGFAEGGMSTTQAAQAGVSPGLATALSDAGISGFAQNPMSVNPNAQTTGVDLGAALGISSPTAGFDGTSGFAEGAGTDIGGYSEGSDGSGDGGEGADGGGRGSGGRGDGGGGGYGSGFGGGSGAGGSGGFGGYGGYGAGAANGGEVKGKGTGTSDSIKALVSDGEYIMSADVVNKLGAQFFDQLQEAFHTPVTPNSSNWKKSAPPDSDGE